MKQQLAGVCWKRISIKVTVGVVLMLAVITAYDAWRRSDGWCVQYYPDGSEKVLYRAECQ